MNAPAGGGEAWRYCLSIPPLPYARYRRASILVLKPFAGGRRWRSFAIALAIGCPVGAAGGYALARAGADLEIGFHADRPDVAAWLSGLDAVLAFAAIVLLTLLAAQSLTAARNGRVLRRLHAASRGLNARSDLLLGEHGLEWRGADGLWAYRWSGVATLVPDGDTHYLRLDGVAFLWLPDAALGDAPRRAEILAFIADRIARAVPLPAALA